jgi:hypothetical protein
MSWQQIAATENDTCDKCHKTIPNEFDGEFCDCAAEAKLAIAIEALEKIEDRLFSLIGESRTQDALNIARTALSLIEAGGEKEDE